MAELVMSDGVRLHVEMAGPRAAPTVVLVHGLAGSTALQWQATGVIERLVAADLHVVAFDLRGHGRSDAPHGPEWYGDDRMVRDLVEVVAACAGPDAVVVGYSMGAATLLLALEAGLAVRAAVVAAAAPAVLRWAAEDEDTRSAALAALRGEAQPDAAMSAWLGFLDAIGADRAALAGVLVGLRPVVEHWDRIAVPVVVVAGDADPMAAPPGDLAAHVPGTRSVVVPGDHITAAAAPQFTDTIVELVDATARRVG